MPLKYSLTLSVFFFYLFLKVPSPEIMDLDRKFRDAFLSILFLLIISVKTV